MSSFQLKNIQKLYSPDTSKSFGSIKEYNNVNLLVENGLIIEISDKEHGADKTIDCTYKSVLPGFIDCHTHPVFWKTREDEFIMRVQGKSYEEIAKAGGGIRNSVRHFRNASKEDIKSISKERIKKFFEYGTTTIEAKSGYGLSTKDEVKSLEIIDELNNEQALEMIPTFLGAHEIPDEYQENRREFIKIVNDEMIPLVAKNKLAKFCDVFCEKGVFTVDESREILNTGKKYGLVPKLHADELNSFGGAELGAELKAISADHLVKISQEGIKKMAVAKVIAVLLPGTTFFLGKDEYAPARQMLATGCNVAIATDYNPGSSTTQNMQLMWTIAALKLKMLPNELLWSTTHIAAKAIKMEDKIGSIDIGKQADLIVLNIPNLNYLPYHYGINHVEYTIKKGNVVYGN